MVYRSALHYALEQAKVMTTKNQWFIPITRLDEIVTEGAVRNALQVSNYLTTDIDALVPLICRDKYAESQLRSTGKRSLQWLDDLDTTCRRIFAILVLIGKDKAHIVQPIVEALCDLDLPLNICCDGCLFPRHVIPGAYGAHPTADSAGFHTSEWTAEDRKRFFEAQWSVLSPVLETNSPSNVYPSSAILPWNRPRRDRLAHWEDLIKSNISAGHHKFPHTKPLKDPRCTVAISLANPPIMSSGVTKTLLENLRNLGESHQHIVELLADFYHGDKYHVVFPWPQGTLRDLWKETTRDIEKDFKVKRRDSLKRWVLEQCLAVAKALAALHSLPYAHGRVRPEYIFWYYETNSLAVPLSLGDMKIFDDTTDPIPVIAPSLSEDIWGLGCLYFEFVTWYILGPGAVDNPNQKQDQHRFRQLCALTDQDFETGNASQVIAEISKLCAPVYNNERCCEVIGKFVDFVFNGMLLRESATRVTCYEVVQVLEGLVGEL